MVLMGLCFWHLNGFLLRSYDQTIRFPLRSIQSDRCQGDGKRSSFEELSVFPALPSSNLAGCAAALTLRAAIVVATRAASAASAGFGMADITVWTVCRFYCKLATVLVILTQSRSVRGHTLIKAHRCLQQTEFRSCVTPLPISGTSI